MIYVLLYGLVLGLVIFVAWLVDLICRKLEGSNKKGE